MVYVVGVNVQDVQEQQTIASEPLEKFLFNTANYNILQDFSGSILQTLCLAMEGKIQGKRPPERPAFQPGCLIPAGTVVH